VSKPHIHRWKTREITVGDVNIGADNPIRLQSMTTTDTQDVAATVKQTIQLAEAGCEIVRITAPNVRAAKALGAIRKQLDDAGCTVPLAADIHFLPQAAMEAVEHVEKVRVNPGNYADRKKFQIREYTDAQYDEELQRLHDGFSPLVSRAKELGRALRIGTNHGSLSDRILNRYGDTPLGMVESAMEFIRIAETHVFHDIVLSMKASNPKVMIQAYRLAVEKMSEEGMNYPLHLGVTEAGDGEDGRIKSAIGIGALLLDGYGDTIRVSLTEDPVHEIPVARKLAQRAEQLWTNRINEARGHFNPVRKMGANPFEYARRETVTLVMDDSCKLGEGHPPRLIAPIGLPMSDADSITAKIAEIQTHNKDAPIEGPLLKLESILDLAQLDLLREALVGAVPFLVVEDMAALADEITKKKSIQASPNLLVYRNFQQPSASTYEEFLKGTTEAGFFAATGISPDDLTGDVGDFLAKYQDELSGPPPMLTLGSHLRPTHPLAAYRELAAAARQRGLSCPIWIRIDDDTRFQTGTQCSTSTLLDAALLAGPLLCDGVGDAISIGNATDTDQARTLGYNLLQGARARISKTEFVACPSCGRTLFDLESTTQKVKERTGHLKGVTIAVMGCIVNGPGEMADADFGYVGGAPGKINLYVGKDCVQTSIPEAESVERLVALIQKHGKWSEPATPS
jgi:(E)-4-hydroxy-3-methylbut-2-enyl-diphosphate synthase